MRDIYRYLVRSATKVGGCTMLLLEELGKCPFVGKGSTGEYLVYIVMINLVKLSSC